MSELAFPEIIDPPSAMTPVAAAALDLRKVDLTDVALAQFGEWRAEVARVKANLQTLALDLSTQAKIDEAKSLRWRLIGQPRAGARATAKELKSKLAKVSKAIGAEEDAIVLAWDEAESLITPHIDARQAELDAEKERAAAAKAEAARLEAERQQRHEDGITTLAGYVGKAKGWSAERMATGIAFVEKIQIDPAHWQEYTERARATLAETLETLRTMHAAQVKAEAEAAELAALRAEKAAREQREREEAEAKARAESQRLERLAEESRQALAREHARLEAERIAELEAGAPKPQDAELVLAEAPLQQDTMTLPAGAGTITAVAPDSEMTAAWSLPKAEPAPAPVEEPAAEPAVLPPTITIGDISARLGFIVTAEFIIGLGFVRQIRIGRGVHFLATDWPRLCDALVKHIQAKREAY